MDTELMEKKLYDACLEGDVEALESLMREDKLILARLSLFSCSNQTPLHLACMLGHFEFAKSLLSYKPDFASRLDSQGCSALHLASANGYADIVKLLLQHDRKMCRVSDEDGRTPLQLAVMNGQHEAVSELIKVNSESYKQELGTALHLCVIYNRLNILILILEFNVLDLSNIRDDKGNTILHSATALKRMQIIKYLVKSRGEVVDVNAVNEIGLTAWDIIEQMPKDAKTMEIKELLTAASTWRVTTTTTRKSAVADQNLVGAAAKIDNNVQQLNMWKKIRKTPGEGDDALLIAASVIAAMAYQAAISPPGALASVDDAAKAPAPAPQAGASALAYFHLGESDMFWIYNTVSFITALIVIFLYVSGEISPKRRIFILLVRGGVGITVQSMVFAYAYAVLAINKSPSGNIIHQIKKPRVAAPIIGLLAWMLVISLYFLVLVYRLLRYVVWSTFKITKRVFRKNNTSQDAAATFTTPNTFNV